MILPIKHWHSPLTAMRNKQTNKKQQKACNRQVTGLHHNVMQTSIETHLSLCTYKCFYVMILALFWGGINIITRVNNIADKVPVHCLCWQQYSKVQRKCQQLFHRLGERKKASVMLQLNAFLEHTNMYKRMLIKIHRSCNKLQGNIIF